MTDRELEQLFETLRHVEALRVALDETEFHLVHRARELGIAWEDIGDQLGGIARQSARQRYAKQQRRYRT